jgi:hypothetical protein
VISDKAWIVIQSPRFSYLDGAQDIGVAESIVKLEISPIKTNNITPTYRNSACCQVKLYPKLKNE